MCLSAQLAPFLLPRLLSLPHLPITYWELGERARAQLASKITLWSTCCLRAQRGRGRGASERATSCHTATAEKPGLLWETRADIHVHTACVFSVKASGRGERGGEMLRHLRRATVPAHRFVSRGKSIWHEGGNRSLEMFQDHRPTEIRINYYVMIFN